MTESIKIPCNVGDTVFAFKNKYIWNPDQPRYDVEHVGIDTYEITNLMITQNKKKQWTKKYRAMKVVDGKTVDSSINFSFDELGKRVFIIKEDAEKLLNIKGE